ncbi:hypothetical protein BABA_11951 [Neobacillus bataviensis LMG 21833]|uniref:Uncharacterized protein n=1 Tax=Neobacillus bataviensis LMG 21833 TaxID=1117379 RepID=K6CCA0_9BACI|nr:hypothetical protein BABA_11951 [Neobacillus bataviensis LMG 21833]
MLQKTVIDLKQRRKLFRIGLIFIIAMSGFLIPTNHSSAVESILIGFVIEADQLEGTIKGTNLINGETADQPSRPMLELKFEHTTVKGLKIKKLVKTPNGIVTNIISSGDTVLFNNLSLSVTNPGEFETYTPASGNIGLKNVKLLAHLVTSDHSILPKFNLSFEEGGKVELEPMNETVLKMVKSNIETILISQANQASIDPQGGQDQNLAKDNTSEPSVSEESDANPISEDPQPIKTIDAD